MEKYSSIKIEIFTNPGNLITNTVLASDLLEIAKTTIIDQLDDGITSCSINKKVKLSNPFHKGKIINTEVTINWYLKK